MKRLSVLFLALFLSLAPISSARDVWMEKGTVSGSITRIDANDTVVEREFTMIVDGDRIRYDVHFKTEGYNDYSQIRTPFENTTLVPGINYFQRNSVLGLEYTNSILQAGLTDGRAVEMGSDGFPKLVYDEQVTWRYTSWQPGVVDYTQFNLAPRSEDSVEYWVPESLGWAKGSTLIYTNTSDLPVNALLSARLATNFNCAEGSLIAAAAVLKIEDFDVDDLSVKEDGTVRMSDVLRTLRDNNIHAAATIFDLDAMTENDVALVNFPGAKHMVLVTHVTSSGAWVVDMTSRRFLGHASRQNLEDAFSDSAVALVISKDRKLASDDSLVEGISVAGRECNIHSYHFKVFYCPSFCEGAWCGWINDRWNCGDGVGTCYDRLGLPWTEGAPCYTHPFYGCIGDWSQSQQISNWFCG